ncbi:MAG: CoA-binding protein [Pseudomonadales bacterium]|jgi:predicted CoA-binding protein|nr:CoA-binding protein [Pseudomonadales bacterium]
MFQNPDQKDIDARLRAARTIAVVGLSADATRPSHGVARSLQGFGYRIVPVTPAAERILGEVCFASLEEAVGALGAETIDIVDVFRRPQHVKAIVDDCIRLKLRALWLQDGVIDANAAARAVSAGIFTIMDRCIYRDRAALPA